ncbi:LCP family protein [Ruminococcus sp. HUN007]|uniref:LCP family protein n=1 Tax=Ruminococcus sp. HUN007 TaxID=1514668 RepID=UPI000679E598|nr:LCP family protein [Ruminococcus sp. HUN007]
MSYKDSNDNQDTMKFRVPAQAGQTRIYRTGDIESEKKRRAELSAANKKAHDTLTMPVPVKKSTAPTANTHKKRRVTANSQAQRKPSAVQNTGRPVQKPKPAPPSSAPYRSSTPAGSVIPPEEKEYSNVKVSKTASKSRNRRKKSRAGLFVRLFIVALISLFLIYSSVALYYISKVTPLEVSGDYVNDPETMLYSSEIKNILIIGEDTRDTSTRGLSDSMILLSINNKKKRFQMTSFMRDIYTEIDGCGEDKLNAAYAYGGAELLKDTIEDNFKIRIDGCVTVNFQAVAHLVDAVGGVQITVSAEEAHAVNEILYSEVNELMGDDPNDGFLPEAEGTFLMNGKQALSYSRIRYIGDADFERTQRQRTVITQMMKRIKKIRPSQFSKSMSEAVKYIGSDMSVTDMYLMSLYLPFIAGRYEIEQLRVPAEGTWSFDETWDGMSILTVDFYANTEYLRNNIYLTGKDTVPAEDSEEDENTEEDE